MTERESSRPERRTLERPPEKKKLNTKSVYVRITHTHTHTLHVFKIRQSIDAKNHLV